MLIDIPRFEDMSAEDAAREAGRVLRELTDKVNEELDEIRAETQAELKKIREGLKR